MGSASAAEVLVRAWPALVLATLAVAVGCAAPSIGEEPQGLSDDASEKPASSAKAAPAPTATVPAQAAVNRSAPVLVSPDAGAEAAAPVPCTEASGVPFHGHCYFALDTASSWDDAQAACASSGAHLATLTTAAEQTAAAAIVQTVDRWIGLRRPTGAAVVDASYAWVTSEPRGFANWSASQNEPDGSCPTCTVAGTAECARVQTNGTWADDACAVKHPALCERE
jgi:hypothetical protein